MQTPTFKELEEALHNEAVTSVDKRCVQQLFNAYRHAIQRLMHLREVHEAGFRTGNGEVVHWKDRTPENQNTLISYAYREPLKVYAEFYSGER